MYHCFAVGLVRGAGGPPEFGDECAVDPQIQQVRKLVTVTLDPNLAADSCRMTATMADGKEIGYTVEHATGSMSAPMTDEQLQDKVTRLADRLDDPARLWDVAWRLDEMAGAADLFAVAK